MISKTHARDFPAISAARTLPLREYRSPSGIEWSPVAMEIEIYGRTDGARLAAHGIQGCRYLPVETYSQRGLSHVYDPLAHNISLACVLWVYVSTCASIARVFTKMTFFSLLITRAIRKTA